MIDPKEKGRFDKDATCSGWHSLEAKCPGSYDEKHFLCKEC